MKLTEKKIHLRKSMLNEKPPVTLVVFLYENMAENLNSEIISLY